MGLEKVKHEGEVGGGEDGEGFDEDVGGGFIAGEMGVELVSVEETHTLSAKKGRYEVRLQDLMYESAFR